MKKRRIHRKTKIKKKQFLKELLLISFFVLALLVLIIYLTNYPRKKHGSNGILFIHSPLNKTYYTENIILNVSSKGPSLWIKHKIDDNPLSVECYRCFSYIRYDLNFKKGTHRIMVQSKDYNRTEYETAVVFTVDV